MHKPIAICMLLMLVSSLAAHPAINAWEEYGLKGRIRIMCNNPELGDPQRIIIFDNQGKILRTVSFGHFGGRSPEVPLQWFINHDLPDQIEGGPDTDEGPFDFELIDYEYVMKDSMTIKRIGRDYFGKITDTREYIYQEEQLTMTIDRTGYYETETLWDADGKIVRKVDIYLPDGSEVVVIDNYLSTSEIVDNPEQEVNEYDVYGNIVKTTYVTSEYSYVAGTIDYVYWGSLESVSGSADPSSYPLKNIYDGNLCTTCVANSHLDGIGNWIQVNLDEKTLVRSLEITPGYNCTKNGKDLFIMNNRLKKVTITLSDGHNSSWQFDGKTRTAEIPINASTQYIRITIDSVYPGSKWRDTCISEIRVKTE